MLGSVGLFVVASMAQVAAEPASVRINLVAEVPVTCSTGAILSAEPTSSGLRAALAGSCNADHVVKVTLTRGPNARGALLNGQTGQREQDSFQFLRAAYFSSISMLELNFADMPAELVQSDSQIVVEISPA